MKQGSSLSQQTALRTRLSPQQVRFVRLLEMSGAEFEQAVADELAVNPALDQASGNEELALTNTDFDEEGHVYKETADEMQAADFNADDDVPDYLSERKIRTRNVSADDKDDFTADINRRWPSLLEALSEQLDVVDGNPRDIALARYLTGYLDNNGRLSRSLADIADDISISTGISVSRADLVPALDIIRYELDPPGLGAVDLRECLLIQLRRRQPKTLPIRVAEEIIDNYFDLFTLKHIDRLESALGVEREVVDEAFDVIRTLDPKPGGSLADIGADRVSHITPDFIVNAVEGQPGRYSVSLNQYVPELVVERSFMTDPNTTNQDARIFVRRKRDEAQTFINLTRRRTETLLNVMEAIVKLQRRFFDTEDKATLRPMILDDVVAQTGYDRSVISRATSGKYVATEGNIYPLKMFFSDNPLEDSDTSSSQILAELQSLIDNENKRHPLSDRALTERLNEMGYNLARRTVTKYREKNNIPVARLRKEY